MDCFIQGEFKIYVNVVLWLLFYCGEGGHDFFLTCFLAGATKHFYQCDWRWKAGKRWKESMQGMIGCREREERGWHPFTFLSIICSSNILPWREALKCVLRILWPCPLNEKTLQFASFQSLTRVGWWARDYQHLCVKLNWLWKAGW